MEGWWGVVMPPDSATWAGLSLTQQRTTLFLIRQYRINPANIRVMAPDERTIDTFNRWATSKWGDRIWSPFISSAGPLPGEAALEPHMIPRSSQAGGRVERDCSRLAGGCDEVRPGEGLLSSTL